MHILPFYVKDNRIGDRTMITIQKIILHRIRMELKSPFVTSFGLMKEKEFFVIEMIDGDGYQGFGESVAFTAPWYTEETVKTTEHMIQDFLIPLLFQGPISHPDEVSQRFAPIRRNNMAKAALEGAVWDLYAKRKNATLAESLGGTKSQIDVGISIGIQPTIRDLLQVINQSVEEGYKRIKIKIKPGYETSLRFLGNVIGPMMGGILAGYLGISSVFYITSGLLVISGTLLLIARQHHLRILKHTA